MNKRTFIVIGLGSMGTRRVNHCLTLGYNVLGFDLRNDRMQEASKTFNIETFGSFLDLEKYIKQNNIDGIFICTPPAEHFRYIHYCYRNGINFMVEQPIVHTKAQLELIKSLRKNQLSATLAHISCNMSFSDMVCTLFKNINTRVIDKPLAVLVECAEYLPNWHPYEPMNDYYPSSVNMGGGLDVICDLDWLCHLFGEIESSTAICNKLSDLDIDTNDIAQYIFKFKDGPQVFIHEDTLQQKPIRTAKLISQRQIVMCDFIKSKITLVDDNKNIIDIPIQKSKHFMPIDARSKSLGFKNHRNWSWIETCYLADTMHFINIINTSDVYLSNKSLKRGLTNLKHVLESTNV